MGLSFTFNGSSIQIRIRKLKWSMITKATSVFKDPDVAETMSIIHHKYVVVPDKNFEVVFPIYGLWLTIFWTFSNDCT
jgi:hypothetical protein